MSRALLLLALVGCRQVLGIPGSGDEGAFFIAVEVVGADGATDGASVLVVIDGEEGSVEVLSDQTTQLAIPLFDRQSFEITPNTGNCQVVGGSGQIANADAFGIRITCDGLAALRSFGFSAPLTFDPAFTGSQNEPRPLGSIIVQHTDWDPDPFHDEATIANAFFMGQPAGSGPFPIATGGSWSVSIANATFERSYTADPLRAPPLAYGFGKSSAPASGARFGSAIAAAGNDLAVGAPDVGAGRVFVSMRTGASWVETQVIDGPSDGARFGTSIAMTSDTLAIGAPGVNSVFVYARSGSTWMLNRTLLSGTSTTTFGTAVAIENATTIFVGDPDFNASGAVMRFAGTTPTNVMAFGDAGDRFGESLAIAGNLLVVGAPGDDSAFVGVPTDNSFADAGAVYAFVTSDLLTPEYIKAIAPGVDDRFGTSVALDTTGGIAYLVVGAPFEDSGLDASGNPDPDDNSQTASGAAYVFQRQSTWILTSFVKAPNAQVGDNFGRSVAIASHVLGGQTTRVIAVGAPFEDSSDSDNLEDEGAVDSGAIYAFSLAIDGAVTNASYGKADRVGATHALGTTIALTSQTLIAGAPAEDSGLAGWTTDRDHTAANAGAVFTFR